MNSEAPRDESHPEADFVRTEPIRNIALGALLAGGVCLYFGFTWMINAPGSASEAATEWWFAADEIYRWTLRLLGVAFLVVAGLTAIGKRGGALLATIVEAVFAVLMVTMAVDTFLESRADGYFDAYVILLLVLAVVGVSAARHAWALFVRSSPDYPA